MEDFTYEAFADRLGETFRVDGVSGVTELQLASAQAGPPRAVNPDGRASFSILFVGPLEPVLPQRIYAFEHDELGAFDLFIVPLGPDQGRMQYEAVFG